MRTLGRAAIAALGLPAMCFAAPEASWPVAGQQGIVRFVIVPADKAADERAYEEQIVRLCEPEASCFLNFYTNSTGVKPEVPLPDAIAGEATATYRRSLKNGARLLTWSCRLKVPDRPCF